MEDDGDVPARGRVRMLIRETQRCLPPYVLQTGKGGNADDLQKWRRKKQNEKKSRVFIFKA